MRSPNERDVPAAPPARADRHATREPWRAIRFPGRGGARRGERPAAHSPAGDFSVMLRLGAHGEIIKNSGGSEQLAETVGVRPAPDRAGRGAAGAGRVHGVRVHVHAGAAASRSSRATATRSCCGRDRRRTCRRCARGWGCDAASTRARWPSRCGPAWRRSRMSPGSSGSFVCTPDGRLVSREISAVFDDGALAEAGSRLLRMREAFAAGGDEMEVGVIRFQDHRIYIKTVGNSMLMILTEADGEHARAAHGRQPGRPADRPGGRARGVGAAGRVPAPVPAEPARAPRRVEAPPGMRRFRGRDVD